MAVAVDARTDLLRNRIISTTNWAWNCERRSKCMSRGHESLTLVVQADKGVPYEVIVQLRRWHGRRGA